MIVFDGTATAVETHVQGPGHAVAHCYPDESRIALCMYVRGPHEPQGHGRKCPVCLHRSHQRDWSAR